jgi:hypothetical protein
LDDFVVGVDFFTNQAKEILAKIAPEAPFFPPPTEEEIVVEADGMGQAVDAGAAEPAGEALAPAPERASEEAGVKKPSAGAVEAPADEAALPVEAPRAASEEAVVGAQEGAGPADIASAVAPEADVALGGE